MRVQRLSRKDKAELVALLSLAFHEYPVMRYILKATGAEYETLLQATVDFFCEVRFLQNWPVLGIRENGSLVAAALVNEPTPEPIPLPQRELDQLRTIIGEDAHERNILYEEKSTLEEPGVPHHFLGMIGVLPQHQGKGLARDLLNAVKEMAVEHAESNGVCLNTEDRENVALYQHFGYEVISEFDVEELHSWCMFLPVSRK